MKTLINIPNPTTYMRSLLLAVLAGAGCYLLLQQLKIIDTAYFLAVGLVIGHLVAMLFGQELSIQRQDTQDKATVSLYVGNLAYKAREDSLLKHFGQFGRVYSVRIMSHRHTNKPKGYGFVEMDKQGAERAMHQLNDTLFFGRTLKVSAAHQQAPA